jgi:hypothetical protein
MKLRTAIALTLILAILFCFGILFLQPRHPILWQLASIVLCVATLVVWLFLASSSLYLRHLFEQKKPNIEFVTSIVAILGIAGFISSVAFFYIQESQHLREQQNLVDAQAKAAKQTEMIRSQNEKAYLTAATTELEVDLSIVSSTLSTMKEYENTSEIPVGELIYSSLNKLTDDISLDQNTRSDIIVAMAKMNLVNTYINLLSGNTTDRKVNLTKLKEQAGLVQPTLLDLHNRIFPLVK